MPTAKSFSGRAAADDALGPSVGTSRAGTRPGIDTVQADRGKATYSGTADVKNGWTVRAP
ncbi:MAG: hypothetical protein AB9869_13305 [Verrucomicrobiia bacterium]